MRFRSTQLQLRIAQRRESKEEEAARIVQHYYRNKLRLGQLGGLLANLAEEKAKQDREHQAAERARQRRERMVREQEQIAYSEKAKALEKRRRALAEALKNLAAVEFVQKILRGYVARAQRRKLTKERKEYLRGISSLGSNGRPMQLVVKFQRRLRTWLAMNELVRQPRHSSGLHPV